MNAPLLTSLEERLEALHQQYQLHFAGQMRATRDLEMIGLMIEAVEVIGQEAGAIAPNGGAARQSALLELSSERLALYRNERVAIEAAATELGPEGIEAARLGAQANSVFHAYRRHFAGQSRSTRDLGLLMEMIADLKAVDERLAGLYEKIGLDSIASDRAVIANYLKLLTAERGEIQNARDAGTLDERAGTLAHVANGQFALYGHLFAGLSRVSRRPELLERMIEQLEAVLARMEGLQEVGLHAEHNRDNAKVVRERMTNWKAELAAIRQVREQTSLLAMVEALGEAADGVLQVYNTHFAGEDRKTRELDVLDALCTRMGELVRQMLTLSRVRRLTANERNLSMAWDALHMLETEWDEVARVQQAPGAPD